MAGASTELVREPTAEDIFWFNIARSCVGGVVLGLTALMTIFCATPLFIESTYPAPPTSPPMPAQPFTWWSDEDTRATRMILLISGCQALLVAAVATCLWQRGKKRREHENDAAALRRQERDARRAKKQARRERDATGSEPGPETSITAGA